MADLVVQENKETFQVGKEKINVVDSIPVVYVVLRNQTIYNKKTKQTDEVTNILRVFVNEDKAKAYVIKKTEERGKDKSIQYYSVPTVFGDI